MIIMTDRRLDESLICSRSAVNYQLPITNYEVLINYLTVRP